MSEATTPTPPRDRPVRVLRVIARMIGGPAYHVSVLSSRMDERRFTTLLAHGTVGRGEAGLDYVAEQEGCATQPVPGLGPELHPIRDVRALVGLVRLVRRYRPEIVHTHTAKAGMLGRLAALSVRPRPVIVHTYHGHVLEGYFDAVRNALYRGIERALARVSDLLIGVSDATVSDLVRLRIAKREKFRVVPVGLDLERFAEATANGRAPRDEVVLTWMGRLVPIKRVDMLIRAVARARDAGARVRLDIVGEGVLRPDLEALANDVGVAESVNFTGHVEDVAPVTAAADVAVLSSANEGTPVALIEAAAAGKPAIATRVGGVPDVVVDGTGIVVPPDDEEGLAEAIGRLASNPDLRESMGRRAQEHVLHRFDSGRLVADMESIYEELLAGRR